MRSFTQAQSGSSSTGPNRDATSLEDVHHLLDRRDVRAVFQPIVDLGTETVVGYEALARGPDGSPFASPAALFPAAAEVGRTGELDWICRAAALRGARDAGLHAGHTLFLNAEPAAFGAPCPPDLLDELGAGTHPRVVVELTERALAADPEAVLRTVEDVRTLGWAVALDDVGAHPDSLAMLPFVRPDVVKLDMALIQRNTDAEVARVVTAVLAYAERTGAVVLAEGIEHDGHLAQARAVGAALAQGWAFGRPGPLPETTQPDSVVPVLPRPRTEAFAGAFDTAVAVRLPRCADKRTLLAFSRQLEQRAVDDIDEPVLLSCFQHIDRFTPATMARYARLRQRCALIGAFGVGMPLEPVPGVRGGALSADDPLVEEWTVVVVTPHFAAALIARDLGDDGPDLDRRFEYVLTHDRELVERAAAVLLTRVPRELADARS